MTQPRERPIIFNEWSIQRILAGAKSQTRRVIKPQPDTRLGADYVDGVWYEQDKYGEPHPIHCPYGQAGDALYVRETWRAETDWVGPQNLSQQADIRYAASDEDTQHWREIPEELQDEWTGKLLQWIDGADRSWRPSIHMPKWASRIWLRVEDVRVERVQDISAEDAWDEGVPLSGSGDHDMEASAIIDFSQLWDDINADRGYGWDMNCWVWAITFSVLSTTGKPAEQEATTP